MKHLTKTARTLKVTLRKDFGVKPIVKRSNIVETAVAAGTFSTLVAAVKAAGLVEALSGGLITVLAPTDEAFAKLEAGTVEALLNDIPKLQTILKHHVIEGSNNSKRVAELNGKTATSLNGTPLGVKTNRDGEISIDGAKVTASVKCSNGIIHVLDTVLIPK